MTELFELGDVLAAVADWERYRDEWSSTLKKAKQPEPTKVQLESLRDTAIEFYLLGRASKKL